MKLLIVRLDHLGDILLMTPLVRALHQAGHEVDVLVPRALTPVFGGNPACRECFGLEEVAPGFPRSWWPLAQWMRARKYDAVLLPNGRSRPLLLSSFFSGARRRLTLSGSTWGRLTLHECLPMGAAFASQRHYADIQLDLARALDVAPVGLELDYFPRPEEIEAAREQLDEIFGVAPTGPLVGVHPGNSGNTCNLPPRVYGELVEIILAQSQARVVITGTANERRLVDDWPEAVRQSPRVWLSHGALQLRQLGGVLSNLRGLVVVGTGPLHLAAALRTPTVSPFCTLPRLCPAVWGNRSGPHAEVEPVPAHCEAWERSSPHRLCDFRGEVTAAMLWLRLAPLLK